MFPASKKLIDGIKLRAVAHVLVHIQNLCQDATKQDKQCNSVQWADGAPNIVGITKHQSIPEGTDYLRKLSEEAQKLIPLNRKGLKHCLPNLLVKCI